MSTITELKRAVADAKADYLATVDDAPPAVSAAKSAVVKHAMAKLSAFVAGDAAPCCDKRPHGMVQPVVVKKKLGSFFETGCLVCGRRVVEPSIEAAREAWAVEAK